MQAFAITRKVKSSFEETLAKIPGALKQQGFGVLTEIDVQQTLKQKIDVDFRRYKILGACNPALAHQALSANLNIGLLLPCNVIVYEDDAGDVVVSIIDPVAMAGELDAAFGEIATEARAKLQHVAEAIS